MDGNWDGRDGDSGRGSIRRVAECRADRMCGDDCGGDRGIEGGGLRDWFLVPGSWLRERTRTGIENLTELGRVAARVYERL